MERPIIYHGSDHKIEKPMSNIGNPYNDYGLGFYCTRDIKIAKEWVNKTTSNGYLINIASMQES